MHEPPAAVEPTTTVPTDVAYVTACALGLAFSQHRDDDAVRDLLRAADARGDLLEAARQALPRYAAVDAAMVLAAAELLDHAAVAVRSAAG